MANRFTDTKKWDEDWYCSLGGEYQHLWNYICDYSDNAGVWRPNKIGYERSTGFKVNLDSFLKKVNGDKQRIVVLDNGRWFLPGFIKYQWFTKQDSFDLVLSNYHHLNMYKLLSANNINVLMVWGLRQVLEGSPKTSMVMVKDKEIVKQKDDIGKGGVGENQTQPLGMEKVKEIAVKVWQDESWKQNISYGHGLDNTALKRWMSLFNASLCNDAMPHFGESLYKKLFGGWLSLQKSKGRKLTHSEVEIEQKPLEKLHI